jgi:Sec23-binding domain of Sec16/WW domain
MNGENENRISSVDEPSDVLDGAIPLEPPVVVEGVNTRNLEESVDHDEINDFEIVDGEDDAYNYVAVLPPGWKEGFDDASGKPYYFSEIDGTIEWVRPSVDNDENGVVEIVKEPDVMPNLSRREVESSDFGSGSTVTSGLLPKGWVEVFDEASGMPYYLNEADGSTSWDRPTVQPELVLDVVSDRFGAVQDLAPEDSVLSNNAEGYQSVLPPGWIEVYDENAGKPYYYDEVNDVATWEMPIDEKIHATASYVSSDEIVDFAKAIAAGPVVDIVGENFSVVDNLSSRQVDSLDKDDSASNLPPGWSKIVDKASGQIYFYCEVDGSTSWDPPRQLSAEDHDDSDVHGHPFGVLSEGVAAAERNDAYESCAAPETTGQEGSPSIPSGWKELSDSDTGQVYYFNEGTGVFSWEFPTEILDEGIDGDKADVGVNGTLDENEASNVLTDLPDGLLDSRAKSAVHMTNNSRHCIGRPAHAVASFGFGGRFCQVQSIGPSGSDVVVIRLLYSVTPNELLVKIERSKQQHGIVGPFNASNENSVSAYVKYKASHFDDLLWNLVSTASISQGKLRSKAGVSDSSSPEALIVRLLLPDDALRRSNSAGKKGFQVQSSVNDELSMETVEKLLLEGQTEKAVAEAVSGGQFALALIIARCCGHEVYARAVQSYVDHTIPVCRPLHTISLLLSGQLHPTGKGLTLPWSGISHSELVLTWKNHLAAILSNRTEEWSQLALSLGDKLYECGEVIIAHFCYMVGGSSLGNAVSNAKMVLLGCDFNPWDVVLATDESVTAFERTEAYEWAKRRGNPLATIHSLQSLKVMYAMLLADFGFVDAAKCYVDSVLHCMDVTREYLQTYELENGLLSVSILTSERRGVLAALNCLDRRLTSSIRPIAMEIGQQNKLDAAPVDTSIENDANASFMTAHTTFNEAALPGRLIDLPLKENRDQQSSLPSRSAMVSPLQPIDEGNSRTERETPIEVVKQNAEFTPSKSISSIAEVGHPPSVDIAQKTASNIPGENRGSRTDNESNKASVPKLEIAPSSAPANLQSSVSKSTPSAPVSKSKPLEVDFTLTVSALKVTVLYSIFNRKGIL